MTEAQTRLGLPKPQKLYRLIDTGKVPGKLNATGKRMLLWTDELRSEFEGEGETDTIEAMTLRTLQGVTKWNAQLVASVPRGLEAAFAQSNAVVEQLQGALSAAYARIAALEGQLYKLQDETAAARMSAKQLELEELKFVATQERQSKALAWVMNELGPKVLARVGAGKAINALLDSLTDEQIGIVAELGVLQPKQIAYVKEARVTSGKTRVSEEPSGDEGSISTSGCESSAASVG